MEVFSALEGPVKVVVLFIRILGTPFCSASPRRRPASTTESPIDRSLDAIAPARLTASRPRRQRYGVMACTASAAPSNANIAACGNAVALRSKRDIGAAPRKRSADKHDAATCPLRPLRSWFREFVGMTAQTCSRVLEMVVINCCSRCHLGSNRPQGPR